MLVTGRRWGKTRLGSLLCLDVALRGGRAWWVAPSYPMATVGWRGIKQLAGQIPSASMRESDRLIVFPGGGSIQVRSADTPDSLRGEGLDFLVIDEAAFVREEAWTEALRPALTDRLGRAMFISTPKGRNWFWRAYQRGVSGEGRWAAWRLPTSNNPFIDPAEIEAAREMLPTETFRQEYLAAFIEDAGLVFRNLRACTYSARGIVPPDGPQARHQYIISGDWAQVADWTVFQVIDITAGMVVDGDRFNQIEWAVQRDRLWSLYEKWGRPQVVVEANSIGGPNIEALQADGMRISGFTTTNESKTQIVRALALAFEQETITIPDDPILIAELEAFEAERLPSGRWRYQAAAGMHDDTVMALAIGWWHAMGRSTATIIHRRGIEDFGRRQVGGQPMGRAYERK